MGSTKTFARASGAEDGPGFGSEGFSCGQTENLWEAFNCLTSQTACQAEKPIVLQMGTQTPYPWTPEVLPLLEGLKKNNVPQYQMEIREVFQVTEMLADLQDEPRRHELELKIWVAESKAYAMVAKLSTPNDEERKKVDGQLMELARQLADLDIQVLELKSDQLDKELGELKDELARARDMVEKNAKSRYDGLVSQVRQRKKP